MPPQKPALSNQQDRKEFLDHKWLNFSHTAQKNLAPLHDVSKGRTGALHLYLCRTVRRLPAPTGLESEKARWGTGTFMCAEKQQIPTLCNVSGVHMENLDFHLSKQQQISFTPKHCASVDHMWRQNSHPAQQRWRATAPWASWKLSRESGLRFPPAVTQWYPSLFPC